jgi:hypothetical protein
MGEEVGVVAAGVFEGVSQDGEAVGFEGAGGQEAVVVGGCRQSGHCRRPPSKVEGHGAEGVADDVAEEVGVHEPFGGFGGRCVRSLPSSRHRVPGKFSNTVRLRWTPLSRPKTRLP